MLLGPPGTVFLVGVGAKKKVFELYSSRVTSLVLVVYLYLAYLILSRGGVGWLENPISKKALSPTWTWTKGLSKVEAPIHFQPVKSEV